MNKVCCDGGRRQKRGEGRGKNYFSTRSLFFLIFVFSDLVSREGERERGIE